MPEITLEYLASQGLNEDFPQRYWSKVNKNGPIPQHRPELGPCWIWTVATCFGDYGQISGGFGRLVKSHRSSWVLHYGPIPTGMWVLHKCDVGRCVRPDHLFLGTRQDNINDMVRKGRQRSGDHNGIKHGMHKLLEEDVLDIRKKFETNLWTQRELAAFFGISFQMIHLIVRRKNWTHI